MKLRIRLGKFLLSVTAFFWTSCTDNAEPLYGCSFDDTPGSFEALESSSSAPIEETSSSSEATSSETLESSSSIPAENLSSSSAEQYKFARDTSVTCTSTQVIYNDNVYIGSNSNKPKTCLPLNADLKNNTTRSIEELAEIEDDLENCVDYFDEPVYGVPPCMNQMKVRFDYKCSDGNTYTGLKVKDGLLYTEYEYYRLFNSSSSEASSSSAAPSPLCQKTDFVEKNDVANNCINEKLDSLSTAGETVSDSLKTCLEKSTGWSSGEYAKTQICDGDTIVNPRYQAKLDSIREEVDKALENCKAAEVPADSAKTPADSTVTPIDTAATSQE